MAKFVKTTRKRLERVLDSEAITGSACRMVARNTRKLYDNTEWTFEGRDEIAAEVRAGTPVIIALWHGRLPMSTFGWDPAWGRFCVVTSTARPGRMVGRIMEHHHLETLPMRERKSNRSASLKVARMAREGVSFGFAVDGPLGPARKCKPIPIDWARLTGAPIWLYTNSFERFRRFKSWDNMVAPKSGGRGLMLYRRFGPVPKRIDDIHRDAYTNRLQSELDEMTNEADRRMGHATPLN